MHKIRLPVGLAFLFVILSICPAPALAEFKSTNKSSEGRSYFEVAEMEAGGAKVECGESGTKGSPEWTIENEGKPAEKGADLRLKNKSWGECTTEIAGITKAVSSSGCEMEAQQPKEEETVAVTVLSTCAFKAEIKKEEFCEIKIEAKENKALKALYLSNSGEKNENMALSFELTGITTTVSSPCAAVGIKATKEGTLTGAVEALQVAPAMPASNFRVSRVGSPMITRTSGEERAVIVSNFGPQASPGSTLGITPAGLATLFVVASNTLAFCQGMTYVMGEACDMHVQYTGRRRNSAIWFRIRIEGHTRSEVGVYGRGT